MTTIEWLADCFRTLNIELILVLIFAAALAIEWVAAKIHRVKLHNRRDSISNFLIGTVSFLADLLLSVISFPLWVFLFDHCRIFDFNSSGIPVFLLLFVLIDFTEYWFHRLSHEVNLLWSAHQVHHQSTFFNLTVGVRTSFFIPFFNLLFYLIFPVLGFEPATMVLIVLVQGVYQLLIHTKLVGKLGWLEYMLVTPSAHRVHHGRNKIYLDRNYGKCFIFWDRLFGTYQAETEPVEFGLKTPLQKNGMWHALFYPYKMLIGLFKKASDTQTKMNVLFKDPDWACELFQKHAPENQPVENQSITPLLAAGYENTNTQTQNAAS